MEDDSRPSTAERSKMYKTNGRDQEDGRRKRREDEVQIRKSRREEMFDKNRRIAAEPRLNEEETPESMKAVVEGLQSMDTGLIQTALVHVTQQVRCKLWTLPFLAKIQILNKISDIYCNRQIEVSTKTLIIDLLYLVSGPHDFAKEQKDATCIKVLIEIFSKYKTQEDVIFDALQALNCFVVRSIAYRNLALDLALIPELIEICSQNLSADINRTIMYIVSVMCEKLDRCNPEIEDLAPVVHIVADGIRSSDPMIQTDAATTCVALAEWAEINNYMQEYEVCTLLVLNLCNDTGTVRPTMQYAINSIIQVTSVFTNEMIRAGLLEKLKCFVNTSYMSQEVCFMISNICAEGTDSVDKVIESGILREVFRVMESAEFRCRREAAFAVCHCCASLNPSHLRFLIDSGMLSSFIDLLTCMDASLVLLILEALETLLQHGDNYMTTDFTNPVAEKLEELGGKVKLEFLIESQNVPIHLKASEIIENFYNDERIDEQEIMVMTASRSTVDSTIDWVRHHAMHLQ